MEAPGSILILNIILMLASTQSPHGIVSNNRYALYRDGADLAATIAAAVAVRTTSTCASMCSYRSNCMAYSFSKNSSENSGVCKLGADPDNKTLSEGVRLFMKVKAGTVIANGTCVLDVQCSGFPNMICSTNKCGCVPNWTGSLNGSSCLQNGVALANSTCEVSPQCIGYPATMSCSMGTCVCLANLAISLNRTQCLSVNVLANGTCQQDSQCSGNPTMTCQNSQCACPPIGYIVSTNRSICLQTNLTSGSSCIESQQCVAYPTMTCSAGSCACPPNLVASMNGALCLQARILESDPCQESLQCVGYPTMTCTTGLCKCPVSYVVSSNRSTCLTGNVLSGGACSESLQCSGYPTMTCSMGICACPSSTHIASMNKTVCLTANQLEGSSCQESQQCSGYTIMTCQAGLCKCPATGYVVSTSGSACLPIRTYNQACTEDVQCSPWVCASQVCACPSGQVQSTVQSSPCVVSVMTQIFVNNGATYDLLYPNPHATYGSSIDLWWCLQTVPGMKLRADPIFWDIEGRNFDYIDTFEGCESLSAPVINRFNPDGLQGPWMSGSMAQTASANQMAVRFVTDTSVFGTGFTMRFTPIP